MQNKADPMPLIVPALRGRSLIVLVILVSLLAIIPFVGEFSMAYALTLGTLSFFIAVIWGKPLIALLKRRGIGKQIRIEGPDSHQVKTGTPTMGGILIVVPVLLIFGTLNLIDILFTVVDLWGPRLQNFIPVGQSTLLLFFCIGSHALLGGIDDWQGVKGIRGKGEGLSPRLKSGYQFLFATVIMCALYFGLNWDFVGIPRLTGPWFGGFFRMGPLIIPIGIFIIVGASNAVNLTDGLDSLAGSIASIAFACYGLIAFLQGQIYLVAFCFTVVGALLAFLWYNAHPAQMFMGDTGSLALGATLGLVALMTGQWLLLPIIGSVFALETGSVMLQVGYFKLTRRWYGEGRRIFKMTPIHHHFELMGWSEMQVKERFWLIAVLSGMLGVALALV